MRAARTPQRPILISPAIATSLPQTVPQQSGSGKLVTRCVAKKSPARGSEAARNAAEAAYARLAAKPRPVHLKRKAPPVRAGREDRW
jgi:hypothetical protein